MSTTRTRLGWAGVAAALALTMTGCTAGVRERCSGAIPRRERLAQRVADHEMSCTVTYKKSDSQWSTDLEGDRTHSTAVINGTFTVDSGSGTLILEGADETVEHPISAEEPVEITDLTLAMTSKRDGDERISAVVLRTTTDDVIEGFSAEYTYTTS